MNNCSQESTQVACENTNIENTSALCPSVVDRYYTKKYEVNMPKGFKNYQETKCTNSNDICILRHSNRLCVITLAPSHHVILNIKSNPVTNVCYKVFTCLILVFCCIRTVTEQKLQLIV